MKKMTEQDGSSLDMVNENLGAIKAIFPEAFTEDDVNFETLRQLLGGAVDEGEEKYGLNWHGKKKARQIALAPSTGTLRPCKEESVDWDTTQNLFVEGDNLEVLKLLQKSYAGKVKMIYIDPPYNTGKEFIYPDKFQDNLDTYLKYTGQKDDEGFIVSSNTESSGRYHTNWLNMMLPRLKLGRTLLDNNGVIFISIGDEEISNLIGLCDQIFGGENFCGIFIWEKKKKPSFLNANMGGITDYIVCYAKNRTDSPPFVAGTVEDGKKYPFNNAGNGIRVLEFPEKSVTFKCLDQSIPAQDMSEGNIITILLNDVDIINGKNVNKFRLKGEWRYSQGKLDEFIENDAEIVISKVPFRPNYINRSGELKKTSNFLSHRTNGVPTNEDATEEMRQLFERDIMSYPKPSGLLKYLVRTVTGNNDVVVDFFSGSGTTAHGMWQQNLEDGESRRFIMVQLPEPCDGNSEAFKAGFNTIADIGKERLRRAASKIKEENLDYAGDLGFKVFKLDSSNIRAWNPDRDDLEQTLLDHTEHLVEGRSEEDVLYELLLKRGVDLTVPIKQKDITGKAVYSIGYGVLFACLSESINRDEVELLAQGITDWHKELDPASDTQVVFRDSAFADDIAKTNMTAILEQNGIAHVRSL